MTCKHVCLTRVEKINYLLTYLLTYMMKAEQRKAAGEAATYRPSQLA